MVHVRSDRRVACWRIGASHPSSLLPILILVAPLAGCENWNWRLRPPEPAPPPKLAQTDDALTAGTIGSETVMANVSDVQPLRGFGLVVGLNGRGSSDCPTVIRDHLLDRLSKEFGPQADPDRRNRLSPSELIDSLDTAVVQVTGIVPAGARKGHRFDLDVRAIPGTSTESLEGGLLLRTELRFFNVAASGQGLVEGAVLAEGGGPLIVGAIPGADGSVADAELRHGYALGGGRALEERPTRLMLLRPNYQLARAIERRINERFGQKPKTAEAVSAGYIELHTPPALAREPESLRAIVAQLYLDNRPAVVEQKLRELARHAITEGANLERVAATWEGVGRSVIAHIQPFYSQSDGALRFYAARTGLRLGDLTALPVVAAAAAPGSVLRQLAIRELGDCDSPQAPPCLTPLLNDADPAVRIAAYEALLRRGNPSIESITFPHRLDQGQINFVLDVVESDGPPLIFVRRTRLPRLAIFGSRAALMPPVFYSDLEDTVTVHTVDGSDDIQVFAKQQGRMSEQLVMPPRVVDLVKSLADLPSRDQAGRLRGIGLPFSSVVRILATLSADGAIPAPLVYEHAVAAPPTPEIAPERPEGERPESE